MSTHQISICSPPDRESLVAMLSVDGEQWAEINVESGELQLQIYSRRDDQPWAFPLADAARAIETAALKLTDATTP